MRIGVISLFPEMVSTIAEYGGVGRAQRRELIASLVAYPRDFTADAHRPVDVMLQGGGPGPVV